MRGKGTWRLRQSQPVFGPLIRRLLTRTRDIFDTLMLPKRELGDELVCGRREIVQTKVDIVVHREGS